MQSGPNASEKFLKNRRLSRVYLRNRSRQRLHFGVHLPALRRLGMITWPRVCIGIAMTTTDRFFSGTSGIVLPVPNKQALPDAYRNKSRLTYYATLFNSLEVNSSFYKVPQAATFAKWANEVPEGFRFSVKLWRGITHTPGLHFKIKDAEAFIKAASSLGVKKGCLLVQLPPGVHADKSPQLQRLLECLVLADAERSWKIAVEFRHPSWYRVSTIPLLMQYRAALVQQDMPDSILREPMGESSFLYMRYHGVAGDYKGSYPDEQLDSDAERIGNWLNEGKEVFVYFNNTIGGALANVSRLTGEVHRLTDGVHRRINHK